MELIYYFPYLLPLICGITLLVKGVPKSVAAWRTVKTYIIWLVTNAIFTVVLVPIVFIIGGSLAESVPDETIMLAYTAVEIGGTLLIFYGLCIALCVLMLVKKHNKALKSDAERAGAV